MKKIHLFLVIFVTILVTISCKKQLKEFNPGGLTDENIYTTKDGIKSLVAGAYSFQRFWYGKEHGYVMTEAGTDLWAPGRKFADRSYFGIQEYNIISNNVAIQAEWTKLYQAVSLCNTGLEKISKVGYTKAEESIENNLKGEIRFLRAFYLWHIVETWGEVPFSTTALTSFEKLKVNILYDYIIADLEFACKYLDIKSGYGRANKNVARAFLSRVYLTRGYGKPNVFPYFTRDESYFQKAIDTASTLIGKYALQSNYADLWKMSNLKNNEVIYALDYSNASIDNYITSTQALKDQFNLSFSTADQTAANINQYGGHNGNLVFTSAYDAVGSRTNRCIEYGITFARHAPTKFLLNLFVDSLDARYSGSFQSLWFATDNSKVPIVPIPGDTSIIISKNTEVRRSTKYKSYNINDMYEPATGKYILTAMAPTLVKFLDNTRAAVGTQFSERDAFIIRYPEVLLIIAEAHINLGNTGAAVPFVNEIRSRAAKPGRSAQMQVSASDMTIDFILDERAREFAGEQMRWFDLTRTGKLEERVKLHNPNISSAFVAPKHYVRPIPLSEVNAGGAAQNPGY